MVDTEDIFALTNVIKNILIQIYSWLLPFLNKLILEFNYKCGIIHTTKIKFSPMLSY